MAEKLTWSGIVVTVQPRIRLLRSFDQRHHSYLGYALQIDGMIDGSSGNFWVGIGQSLHAKHSIQAGDTVEGFCLQVADPDLEWVAYYRVSGFKVVSRASLDFRGSPPWVGLAPALEVYRKRGHRRLAVQTYEGSCGSCIWGSRMAVQMIIDQWNPSNQKFRQETFCYGPKSCGFYRPGPSRKVPGRKGMSWTEEDWVDEDATSHRAEDD